MAFIRTITFNYNANGGSGAPASSTSSYSINEFPATKTKQIASGKPTRQYYTFLGWGSSSGATSATWASNQNVSFTWATGDQGNYTLNLWAVWQRSKITVTYNAQGGTNAPSAQTVNMYEFFTLRTGKPTRSTYRFLGWATSAGSSVVAYNPGDSARFVSNVTLYAVWEKEGDTVSTSNGVIGSAMTLTITKVDNSYTDDITFRFGSTTGTIASGTTALSLSWTPPLSLASEIPNASSGTLTITCATYNGASLVGTTSISVILTVPSSLAPSASVAYADTDATCLSWGLFVQSRSKLSFAITATAQQGATIASYWTQVNGATFNTDSFVTDVLLYSGTNTYTVTVTDSRGLQTTETGTFTVEAYGTPSVSLVSCDRNDSDPEQVDIDFDFSVSSVNNNNDALYSFDYKEKTNPTWTIGSTESLGSYSGTISDFLSAIDQGSEYDIRINVTDSFQTVSVETEVGVSGNILLNSRHNGGLGLLMKSQADNQLDIGKPTVHHGGSVVSSNNISGNYAKILTFGTESTAVSMDVDCPITLEFVMAGYSEPATLTINFNRDYTLNSFTKDASADAYLYNSDTNVWDLYIGRANSSDSVEILDFHNPLGNRDITLTWGNTSISTLPTGYVSATPANTVLSESPNSISLSSGSWKTTASITFSRGIWLLSAFVQFASNTSGRRSAVLSTSQDDGTSIRNMSSDNQTPVNGAITLCRFVDVLQIPTQTTYYLNAYQNSGSSLTTYGRMTAIKIV